MLSGAGYVHQGTGSELPGKTWEILETTIHLRETTVLLLVENSQYRGTIMVCREINFEIKLILKDE